MVPPQKVAIGRVSDRNGGHICSTKQRHQNPACDLSPRLSHRHACMATACPSSPPVGPTPCDERSPAGALTRCLCSPPLVSVLAWLQAVQRKPGDLVIQPDSASLRCDSLLPAQGRRRDPVPQLRRHVGLVLAAEPLLCPQREPPGRRPADGGSQCSKRQRSGGACFAEGARVRHVGRWGAGRTGIQTPRGS